MFEAITSWINAGSPYSAGVALYVQYGSDLFLKLILKKGETPLNRQKLNAALEALLSEARPEPPPAAPAAAPEPAALAAPTVPAQTSPGAQLPALLQVTKQRDQTFAEIRILHPSLCELPEGPALYELAKRIVRLGKKNAELWERYNYLTEGGTDPEPDTPAPAPPVMVDLNLINKREAIRKSLNKAENRIKGKDKPHPNSLELIERRRKELSEIDERIAALKKGGAQ